jgi:hypothetical protein
MVRHHLMLDGIAIRAIAMLQGKLSSSCISVLVLSLAGCTPALNSSTLMRPVSISVAEKVLGSGAFSIDPFTGSDIRVPGIYKIVGASQFVQVCEYDTSLQTPIREMRVVVENNDEIVEDSLHPVTIRVKVAGQNLEPRYRKIKVSGYTVRRVYSGDSRTPEEWILANVNETCRNEILPRNKPYLIVSSVATAKNVETVSGGGTASLSFGAGPATLDVELVPADEQRRRNRVFAVLGTTVN